MRIQHWQDVASLVLGVWLVLSPFALGFAGAAVWMTIVLGLFVVMFAVEGFVIPSYLEEWGEILLGLALVVAPWGRLRVGVGHGQQYGVGHAGDLVWSLGTNDRPRFHHLVARSLASPSQLRRVVA
jgi:SPW repeat-containing protein